VRNGEAGEGLQSGFACESFPAKSCGCDCSTFGATSLSGEHVLLAGRVCPPTNVATASSVTPNFQ
jgi:hypothetical protein